MYAVWHCREDTRAAALAARAADSADAAEHSLDIRGPRLEALARTELLQAVAAVELAGDSLEHAQEELIAAWDEAEHSDSSITTSNSNSTTADTAAAAAARSAVALLESRAATRRRELEAALTELSEAEALLARAQRIRAQEEQLAPLYTAFVSADTAGGAQLFDLLAGLGCAVQDSVWNRLSYTVRLFDVNGNGWLDKAEICALLRAIGSALCALSLRTGSVPTAEAVESTVLRAFMETSLDAQRGMTGYEVKQWLQGLLVRDRELSDVFAADWAQGELSGLMRLKMAAPRQLELGLISMVDLKFK
jgi:hypothetical protein